MDGNNSTAKLVAYLSRLTGDSVTTDRPLALRSVHRAALAAWVRNERLSVRTALISSSAPFTINDLLAGDNSQMPTDNVPTVPAPFESPNLAPGSLMGVGIDIEEVERLPEAADHREHPFFRDNFTPAEIAYAIMQPNPRASFCGLWAAKEAILKSGIASAPNGHLGSIEIVHDARGRPGYRGSQLSISHTERTAVAVCVVASHPTMTESASLSPPKPALVPAAASQPARSRLDVILAAGAMVFLMAAFSYMVLYS